MTQQGTPEIEDEPVVTDDVTADLSAQELDEQMATLIGIAGDPRVRLVDDVEPDENGPHGSNEPHEMEV